jgi:Zn-dependent protease with chaperone function
VTEPTEGWHYDGTTAKRHIVQVVRDGDSLAIEGHAPVRFADLIRRGDGQRAVFGRAENPGWRLGFDGPLPSDWLDALPAAPRYGRLIDRFGLLPAAIGGIALSAVVLFGLYQLPDLIAPLVPDRWEQALGDAIVGDLGGRACQSAEGQAVLDRLGKQLSGSGRTMRVRVVDIPIPNAVALPGGQIALFNGILKQAKSPDEIAGVLGHEIGHVERRHVMAGLIRQFGLGLVLGGSGKGVQYAQALVDARYGRAAESEADGYAIAALTRNHISTKSTADFFARMGKLEKTGSSTVDTAFSWLSNHPVSVARRDMFLAANTKIADPRPAMTAVEWSAVKAMCGPAKGPPLSR